MMMPVEFPYNLRISSDTIITIIDGTSEPSWGSYPSFVITVPIDDLSEMAIIKREETDPVI
jgi:hypothetical protein